MATGFDLIVQDSDMQKQWLSRIFAAIIDVIIVLLPVYIIMVLVGWMAGLAWFMGAIVSGFIWFAYSAILEYSDGATIGKKLLGLRVVSVQGNRLEMYETMMRNLTKVFFAFLIADFLLALLLETTDPRQKFTDRIAKTTVITERKVLY